MCLCVQAAPSETDVVASAHTNIDFGRELAIMHRMLSDHISHLSTVDKYLVLLITKDASLQYNSLVATDFELCI